MYPQLHLCSRSHDRRTAHPAVRGAGCMTTTGSALAPWSCDSHRSVAACSIPMMDSSAGGVHPDLGLATRECSWTQPAGSRSSEPPSAASAVGNGSRGITASRCKFTVIETTAYRWQLDNNPSLPCQSTPHIMLKACFKGALQL